MSTNPNLNHRSTNVARALFAGVTYAGHRSRFATLQRFVRSDERLQSSFIEVTGWRDRGLLERLSILPRGLRGRLRAVLECAPVGWSAADVVWTSAGVAALPHLLVGPRARRPFVVDLDWTLEQQQAMAPDYYGRTPRKGPNFQRALRRERTLLQRATLVTTWSKWAAASVTSLGVPAERVRVVPPGIDLSLWRAWPRTEHEGPMRCLFVGGDFQRKGGDLLVQVIRSRFAETCQLDVVSRDPELRSEGNVRVHRAEPDTPELRRLFRQADLFVMPSRAEAFGIAYLEAMASGLPVIAGDSGGVADIVDHRSTGWIVEPTEPGIAGAIVKALGDRRQLGVDGMGRKKPLRGDVSRKT